MNVVLRMIVFVLIVVVGVFIVVAIMPSEVALCYEWFFHVKCGCSVSSVIVLCQLW